jgi:hypothetical protein
MWKGIKRRKAYLTGVYSALGIELFHDGFHYLAGKILGGEPEISLTHYLYGIPTFATRLTKDIGVVGSVATTIASYKYNFAVAITSGYFARKTDREKHPKLRAFLDSFSFTEAILPVVYYAF